MADKPSDKHKTTLWSKTFGAHADPDGTALNAVKGVRDFFRDDYGPLGMSFPAFAVGIGSCVGVLMAGIGGANLTHDQLETRFVPPEMDAAIQLGVEGNQYGAVGFEHEGRNYMLVRDEGDFRLFRQGDHNRFDFIDDVDDAYAIIRKAGERMVSYAEALENEDEDLPDYKPEILSLEGVSTLYGNDNNPHRFVSAIADREFTSGESLSDVYEAQGDALRVSASEVLRGGYGFDADHSYATRGTETQVTTHTHRQAEEIYYVGLSLLGLALGGGALGSGIVAARAGRRASRRRQDRNKGPNF